MKNQNKVWLEFETNPPTPDAIDLMNKMLNRLDADLFFDTNDDGQLLLSRYSGGGYSLCTDNGSWFSLDSFGKDKD